MAQQAASDECPPQVTAGIDWFRFRVDEREAVHEAIRAAETIQREDLDAGEKRRPWRFQGYEGQATPRIRWGTRGGRLFWETSGAWADSTWTRMPVSSGRLTRLDIQLTAQLSRSQPCFGTRCMPPEAMTPPRRLRSGIPVGLSQLPDGGWLGTVGRRTAPEYFRLYDKGVETREQVAGNAWRLELEAKYDHAEALGCQALELLKCPKWCARYVTSRWRSLGLHWPLSEDEQWLDAVRPGEKPAPSSEAILRWMEHTVRPVTQRMLKAVPVEELLRALGLDVVAQPRSWDDDAR